ncbi:portal protein [Erythrobacter phage vB_EliS-L02]|nr:portal protein [Erythrobacter phage vB_EliS-L02]
MPDQYTPPTKGQVKRFNNRQAHYASLRSRQELIERAPQFSNWDYNNWREIWTAIRHAMIGEVEIKRHGQMYLPQPEGMDEAQYSAYLDRAVFYNMVYRTVTGLTGSIFRRDARLLNAGPRLRELSRRISKDGLSFNVFAKVVAQELLSVGRYGVLVDKSTNDGPNVRPYLAGYTCENILDWSTIELDGRDEFDFILLREFEADRRLYVFEGNDAKPNPSYGHLYIQYRILRLVWDEDFERYVYQQEFYSNPGQDANLTEDPIVSTPLVFGVPMERIPFRFFNATTSLPAVEKPPILDILTLNMSHYKTYAQLEHGRFYTANPVYYVTGGQEDDEYHIGPSVVWEIGTNEKAGIIEFNGQGLKSLEKALETKETQVASLGGRLIGDSNTAGQSDNQVKLKDRNEQSLLLNVTTVLNENFTELAELVSMWLNENPSEDLEFRVNQDFLLDQAAAREFRAITMMYQAGILPIEIIYEYFLKADVIPEYVTKEIFMKMLEDEAQFPNNPDFEAREDGFPDARTQRNDELQRDLDDNETKRDEMNIKSKEKQAKENRKASEKQAEKQDDIPPVPAAARQALNRDNPPAE